VATDTRQITLHLSAFYDFADKVVIDVGAGGGQLAEFARPARQVIAVDRDAAALDRLAARLRECELDARFTLVAGDLLDLAPPGDVLLLEFCLHQMAEPERALAHARTLAPEVVVIDHAAGSPWSWCAAEEEGVEAAWKAVEKHRLRRDLVVEAWQRFDDYAELEARLAACGPESRQRIQAHRGQEGIAIPMPYRLALL